MPDPFGVRSSSGPVLATGLERDGTEEKAFKRLEGGFVAPPNAKRPDCYQSGRPWTINRLPLWLAAPRASLAPSSLEAGATSLNHGHVVTNLCFAVESYATLRALSPAK